MEKAIVLGSRTYNWNGQLIGQILLAGHDKPCNVGDVTGRALPKAGDTVTTLPSKTAGYVDIYW